MRRSIRYVLSVCVGSAVTGLIAGFFDPGLTSSFAILLLYSVTCSLVLAHGDVWYRELRPRGAGRSSPKLGAIGGGVGGGVGAALVNISIPLVAIGVGMLVFGQALIIAEYAPAIRQSWADGA